MQTSSAIRVGVAENFKGNIDCRLQKRVLLQIVIWTIQEVPAKTNF
ncbi:hypothetical protein [Microcoleus sp. FACHB-672]|nr:hypothetical protein [Microcoleus sp. FACHB-672]MBD2040009.1 hypothetical protein [Microcoleus sp. FACHB-672]